MKKVFVVDQTGATFVFKKKRQAEKFLIQEAWRGAEHLTIVEMYAPNWKLKDMDSLADWCVSHAPIPNWSCDA